MAGRDKLGCLVISNTSSVKMIMYHMVVAKYLSLCRVIEKMAHLSGEHLYVDALWS